MFNFDLTKFKENLERKALSLSNPDEKTIGWRYLGSIPYTDCFPSEKLILETNESGWLEIFKICILHEDSNIIILVNDDCPDYYYDQLSKDIKKIILDCLKDVRYNDGYSAKLRYKYDLDGWANESVISIDDLNRLSPFYQPSVSSSITNSISVANSIKC